MNRDRAVLELGEREKYLLVPSASHATATLAPPW
jgi:hypothetical protein